MADIDMQTVQDGGGEVILTCVIAPLRLHVDQDTLDFITRFFTFNSKPALNGVSPDDTSIIYIQRADILPIGVKLDYKPKKVDYGGLRSGKTTELMNFSSWKKPRWSFAASFCTAYRASLASLIRSMTFGCPISARPNSAMY